MKNKSNSYPETIFEKVVKYGMMEECELISYDLEINLLCMKDKFPGLHYHTFNRALYLLSEIEKCLETIRKREQL